MSVDLTCEQRKAVRADGNSWVVACPGSGKTRVALAKILREACRRDAEGSVLALSFSVSARDEIGRRVAESAGYQVARNINVATIHAFCIGEILMPFSQLVFERDLRLALPNGTIYDAVLQRVSSELGVTPSQLSSCLTYARRVPDGRVFQGAEEYDKELSDRATAFWNALFENGYVDYSNALYLALKVLQSKRWIRDGIAATYPIVVVDEFQDCTDIQIAVVDELVKGGSVVTLVGDLHQCVFGFAGANVSTLAEFADGVGAVRNSLSGTHRCPQAVVDVAERVFSRGMHAVGDAADVNGEVIYDHSSNAAVAIQRLVARADELKIDRGAVAFVCTANYRIDQILTSLETRGIAAVPGNFKSDDDDWYGRMTESFLLADHPHDQTDLLKLAEAIEDILQCVVGQQVSGPVRRLIVEAVEQELLCGNVLPDDAIETLTPIIQTRVLSILKSSKAVRRADMDAIEARLAEEGAKFVKKVFAKVTRAVAVGWLRPEGKVRGYTYQRIKGLQFEAVAVVDITHNLMPHRDRKDLWDDARKLYVGLTRSKRLLAVHAPNQNSQKSMFYPIVMGEQSAASVIGSPLPASLSDDV